LCRIFHEIFLHKNLPEVAGGGGTYRNLTYHPKIYVSSPLSLKNLPQNLPTPRNDITKKYQIKIKMKILTTTRPRLTKITWVVFLRFVYVLLLINQRRKKFNKPYSALKFGRKKPRNFGESYTDCLKHGGQKMSQIFGLFSDLSIGSKTEHPKSWKLRYLLSCTIAKPKWVHSYLEVYTSLQKELVPKHLWFAMHSALELEKSAISKLQKHTICTLKNGKKSIFTPE